MPLNITYLIHQVTGGGGMALQAINMAEFMAKKRNSVSMISSSKLKSNLKFQKREINFKYIEIPSKWSYYPPFFYHRAKSIFHKNVSNADIIQCFNPFLDGISAISIKSHSNIPVVIRLGAVYENFYFSKYFPFIGKRSFKENNSFHNSLKIALKKVVNRCSAVVFNSEFLAQYYKEIRNPNKIIIRNGIDISKFKYYNTVPESLFNKYKELNTNSRIILYVGRLEPRKSVETLIYAFSKLQSDLKKKSILIIAGFFQESNHYCSYLQSLVKQHFLTDYVKFIGEVNYSLLPYLYSLAEIVVFTSDYRNRTTEGLPNVVIESMACQRPCLAADVAGVSEVIINKKNGLLFSPNNPLDLTRKIVLLLNDGSSIHKLGQSARKTIVKNHDFKQVTKKYEKLYHLLAD